MTASHDLRVADLTLGYSERDIITNLDLQIAPGKISVIVGANACGKSTLLKSMSRLITPREGKVILDGKEVHRTPAKELARTLGLLPQSPIAPEGITVVDLVGRGRNPHQTMFHRWNKNDDAAVAAALSATNSLELADREVDELSGGQRQRVWIAMALAQETDILLLDEPTTYLDVAHQVEILDLLSDLNERQGTTVVMVLHDLNLAARYADNLIAIKDGQVYAAGTVEEVFTTEMIRDVFGMANHILPDPVSGAPMMSPIGRRRIGNYEI
ncbi:MAG: ABC transporter ATP-binding protein [Corynebacterium casei]|uniref:ABC transporter ATP-binding protein n=1 Tax=Actinomycetes TaxID=1760 RepID=UPI0009C42766|nr:MULTISPECIES: ABC transporter ATP-binding protein [Actinomycetes]MDN5707316.1 ABC transporter ATP-binding protein [Corynebacterium casei]MDN5730054.1 ABC transporter ATP-binding protein [Corynebacterium casei]MDN5741604.1 ABC transporter ATP-binding protein [Corynebacterium casei]MDN5784707.1 ABC transporter ATP-binding protein [Corynebacterium casei]MDN5841674.1 ABC transporter ATP-binding protein [Corynebacterium casei]